MARRKQPHIPDQLLDQLLAGTDAKAAFAKDGLLDELKKHDIDDRRNELSGNVSLNQELSFIQAVNEWVREDKERTGFAKTHKEIDIYMITMAKQLTDSLDLGSKFNRDPAFVADFANMGRNGGRSSSTSAPPQRSMSWRLSSGRLVPWRASTCARASA